MQNGDFFMREALALAAQTTALASPNPQVGCVLTQKIAGKEKIIGRGAHLYAARDHAEIAALKDAAAHGHNPRRTNAGTTAYVTLEPCSHHGRTPPCAEALIEAGIARCIIATADPNPLVAGQGIARLRAAGIAVTLGACQAEARTLNDAFAFAITHQRPFVTLKSALSTDGMLAPPPASRQPGPDGKPAPHWLTGPLARAEVQRLRHGSDAILTGIGTVLADDPALTDRTTLPRRRPLLRIVLDPHLRIPLDSQLVRATSNETSDLWIFTTEAAERTQAEKFYTLESKGAILTALPADAKSRLDPTLVLHQIQQAGDTLSEQRILSLLLEAGPTLNAAFLQANLVDRAVLFYAPVELGPNALPFARHGPTPFALEQKMLAVTKQSFGPDVCVSGLLHNPWPPTPNLL